jgi:hypothetical protein
LAPEASAEGVHGPEAARRGALDQEDEDLGLGRFAGGCGGRASGPRQHVAAREAELRGVYLATPQVSEWYLLGSLLTETGLGLALGLLTVASGGLFAVSTAVIGRRARLLARGSALPDDTIHRTPLRGAADLGGIIRGVTV